LLAFVGGLAMAWLAGWESADLVWSLWLSSLVVGYALIVWTLSSTLREFGANVVAYPGPGKAWMGGGLILGVGFLFGLAFFTVHFGGFHFVHSAFLAKFFPLTPDAANANGFPTFADYGEVFRRYWIFLPLAFLAERNAFVTRSTAAADLSVAPKAIARRKRAASTSGMMAPYKNVMRMHLLIFFFAAAHFAGLENFAVYAVVYAVYFFPFRILRRRASKSADVLV
jgi:hypothetical protein